MRNILVTINITIIILQISHDTSETPNRSRTSEIITQCGRTESHLPNLFYSSSGNDPLGLHTQSCHDYPTLPTGRDLVTIPQYFYISLYFNMYVIMFSGGRHYFLLMFIIFNIFVYFL